MKAIRNGNYLSWPLINVQNVSKHFPESEEAQKWHMRNQQQGVRSTKIRLAEQTNDYKTQVEENKRDIFIAVHDPKSTLYTDETEKIPFRSIRGQKYQVVAHHINSNWTLIKTTKRRIERDLIKARRRILRRMQERFIVLKHQVLENKISRDYK